ncbi:LuxR C-terminal-related transcriptional regulator [Streptomyces griseorubiginosus]|uniref:LuxR C-terminal-related transcriptional regulator n=1 Tax=Streptomyces griseorubiginosus TaxID=67304 RepID=UPI002E7FE48C|nr:helix-turn-helix transcriptional regulator [Streptomyces griseorubiginosus]WUB45539.1 helix-turn-helix transcriptional regulator [Streptomyces griseorubiginosus]WUB54057.1 helix-turn-helix transcriptional regulator [Streptomyces griseorubiginosus]
MSGAHTHGRGEPCEAGLGVYTRTLREGRVNAEEAAEVPCLVELGLLQPDPGDPRRLRPVEPALALHRLLRGAADRIADERRREERLAAVFERLVAGSMRSATLAQTPTIHVLSGLDRIGEAIQRTVAEASGEVLTIQPHTSHTHSPAEIHAKAFDRDQALLDRGGRIRTLYQHTLRHAPSILARYERLRGDVEARTLDEVTQRLIVVERQVAFIPANQDRTLALEVRHPALVAFLATTFDRLWRLATPMHPRAVEPPSPDGVTSRQRAIAALLVEGHTDAVIADRLGMNIRTARVHIAKLAATLGSESRAQLGYLIGQSGILEQEGVTR